MRLVTRAFVRFTRLYVKQEESPNFSIYIINCMSKKKVFNFASGPACVPQEALLEAQKDLLDYQGCGRSVMEVTNPYNDISF
jgi:hypothetical protein